MRRFLIHLLSTALLIGSASTASAIILSSDSSPASGATVAGGEQITVTLTLDTESTAGITLSSTGVIFDDTRLSYNSAASSASSYALFNSGKGAGPYLIPASQPPELRFGTTDQVNVDFTATSLTVGSSASGEFYLGGVLVASGTAGPLATLVFDVLPGAADGTIEIDVTLAGAGNIMQTAAGGNVGATTPAAPLTFTVPEPGLASLSMAALLTLGVLRARTRKQQS